MNKSEILRNAFCNEDEKNGSLIYDQYEEIKNVLENKDIEFSKQKLNEIKQYAIDNTEFYQNFSFQ